jgi:hypothetical protein
MKTRLLLTLLGVLAAGAIGLSGTAVAQGQGGGGGGGGGGAGTPSPPDYGDLIILLRNANGVPIPSEQNGDTGLCWQPIAFNVGDEVLCPATCLVDSYPTPGTDVVSVDQATCAVAAGCSGCTHEVEFGRINEARSSDAVFDSQLEDVVISLATADCRTLDPAGRIVASKVDDVTLDNLAKTIDSPLQNLAIYRELIMNGSIGAPLPDGAGVMDTAARGLGAASDKSGAVNVDMVAYLNMIMGLSDPGTTTILDPKLCQNYREEVQGTVQIVQKCFLDYSAYTYGRATNFGALPYPAYIPEGDEHDGWFEYLALVPGSDPPLFEIVQGPITTAVFGVDTGDTGGNVGGFAQASDDTRAVISFMHANQVPVDFETALPCEASGDIFYDLAISEQSGLQVPKNYVNGGEREFFVNVGNLGPDIGNGTVTVVAKDHLEEVLDEWVFTITALPAGQTASFTEIFTINTIGDEIAWSATVVADPPGTDPNLTNNTRDATSKVRASGGGGGH